VRRNKYNLNATSAAVHKKGACSMFIAALKAIEKEFTTKVEDTTLKKHSSQTLRI
jgi:hypothetical protein